MSDHDKDQPEKEKEAKDRKVEVTIDTKERMIRPGSYTLAELKDALKVDSSKVLEQLIDGKFEELKDTHPITIHGGEVFSSHVPRGGSSWN